MMRPRWIYLIRNLVNDWVYVGITSDTTRRWQQHRAALRDNVHHCQPLQHAWIEHGEAAFSFERLDRRYNPYQFVARAEREVQKSYMPFVYNKPGYYQDYMRELSMLPLWQHRIEATCPSGMIDAYSANRSDEHRVEQGRDGAARRIGKSARHFKSRRHSALDTRSNRFSPDDRRTRRPPIPKINVSASDKTTRLAIDVLDAFQNELMRQCDSADLNIEALGEAVLTAFFRALGDDASPYIEYAKRARRGDAAKGELQ